MLLHQRTNHLPDQRQKTLKINKSVMTSQGETSGYNKHPHGADFLQ